MNSHPSSTRAAILLFLLGVVQLILHVSLLARGEEYVASSLVIDDTYYYLQTAWNTKQLGFVTFDGLHPTNGVQLLWFLLILLLALLAKTKATLLFATLITTFLLNVLCYLFIFKIGAALKRPSLALLMAGLWSLQSLPFRIYSTGMENSLHALVLWCLVWQATLFLLHIRRGTRPNVWGLTAILILNVWTRLDAALLSAIIFGYCVITFAAAYGGGLGQFWRQQGRALAGAALLAAAGLLVQLGAFWVMGGSYLPVSALVKSGAASRGLSAEAAAKFVEVLLLGMPAIVQGRLPALFLGLAGLLAILFLLRALLTVNHAPPLGPLLNLWSCLLLAELLYHLVVAVSGMQYTPYFIWYRSPSFIFWIVTASLATLHLIDEARLAERLRAVAWAPAVLGLLAFATAIYMYARSVEFTSELYVARYEAAVWIADNAPQDAVYAAWNTGQLSFFSDRTFINLDGVINSVDYHHRVLRGATTLVDYLEENRVDYIVDYAIYAALPELPVVRAFPIDDQTGRSIQIWQFPPQLSTAN